MTDQPSDEHVPSVGPVPPGEVDACAAWQVTITIPLHLLAAVSGGVPAHHLRRAALGIDETTEAGRERRAQLLMLLATYVDLAERDLGWLIASLPSLKRAICKSDCTKYAMPDSDFCSRHGGRRPEA